jgi:hypothetical protein
MNGGYPSYEEVPGVPEGVPTVPQKSAVLLCPLPVGGVGPAAPPRPPAGAAPTFRKISERGLMFILIASRGASPLVIGTILAARQILDAVSARWRVALARALHTLSAAGDMSSVEDTRVSED